MTNIHWRLRMSKASLCSVILVCCFMQHSLATTDASEGRKLFGGYKITPRFCKATREINMPNPGPNICMFNHDCASRQGIVVGACMDGFLFGACCQLPAGSAGELLDSDQYDTWIPDNDINMENQTRPNVDIVSNGVSQITESLLQESVITTAQDNEMVQINGKPEDFGYTTGVTHSSPHDTILLNNENNEINPVDFKIPGFEDKVTQTTDRSSTSRDEDSTTPYGSSSPSLIQIAISHVPYVTNNQGFQKPMFRPRPTSAKPDIEDKYVLVPTITHPPKPNKTQELESIVNIIQMLNDSSTPIPFLSSSKPSTIYMQSSNTKKPSSTYTTISTSGSSKQPLKSTTKRPPSTPLIITTTTQKQPNKNPVKTTSRKPPSTSYVFSTTIPPRRTTQPIKKPTSFTTSATKKPTVTKKPPYVYPSSTIRPGYVSSTTKPTTNKFRPGTVTSTKRPTKPSKPYGTSPTTTKRPSTVNTHVVGPSYSVSSSIKDGYSPNYGNPPPTVIVLAPVTSEEPPVSFENVNYHTTTPQPKPVTQLTINNIVTANNNYHFSTSERPPPTILITPKPPVLITAGSHRPITGTTEFTTATELEIETSGNDFVNFPPVRNPNLNISASIASSEDEIEFTTPTFIEDEVLEDKVDLFVNKIVQSLRDPFIELKDVVYNRNKTAITVSSASIPTTKKPVTTKKPTRFSSAKPPSQRPTTRTTTTVRPTSKRTPTRRPTVGTTRRTTTTTVATTTRRPKPTRKVTTTPQPTEEEYEDENATEEELDYRRHCGIRPLMKSGRIVGGKGATFGEWPWQVLVRESTWLGLFTKNKCGGVLINNKFVVTAAHCQPGFLASLVAVFGEYDISGELESKRSLSKNVRRVIVHRQYDAATFENDLALLELESPVQYDQHIVPICLPPSDEDFTGRMATVTGWGRLKYGGGVPSVLQEVQVPIMENQVCQEMFRTAGHSKIILDSFLCAGYANGQKDSCEGDSGGPLVLQRPDGRWQLAGTVSHGIKCAAPYLPGVYMRTTFFKPWLESITGIH